MKRPALLCLHPHPYLRIAAVALAWAGATALAQNPMPTPGPAATTAPALTATAPATDAPALYQQHCASCHGADRLGGFGPALLPQNLERLRRPEALRVIREGRVATQMQGYAQHLGEAQLQALAAYVYTPVTPAPQWGEADIRASRTVQHAPGSLPDKPQFQADPHNLFVVVEAGDHHVSVLDGDRLERIARSPTRFALHGGPKYSPEGRYVYFGSRDGWVSKYDLWNFKTVAEVRAGINTRNVAVSNDGKWVMVGNYLPHNLVLLDAELNLVRTLPTTAAAGGKASPPTSRVSAVYDAAPRNSFVVAMKDTPEIWELSYAQGAPVEVVRTVLGDILDDFYFDDRYTHVFGATRPDGNGVGKGQVVNLDTRTKVADLDVPGMPHLGSGIAFNWQGKRVMATPNLKEGLITLIDTQTWKTVASVPTLGPGFFLRSHEKARYAFTDAMMSPGEKDTLVAIDKETLQIAGKIRPAPGKTFAHVEFTRDGRYALASLMEMDGALIVLDAQTLQEVKRLPMSKPIGKYNVWNKITRSEGTSH